MSDRAGSDRAVLQMRKALLRLRSVPGFCRFVDPIRRHFAKTPRNITVTDFDGDLSLDLSLHERMQSQIFWYGYCSRDICTVVKRLLRAGMVCVDAGANIGEITLVAAKCVGREGKVFSFEPMSRIAERLQANITLNGLSQVNVVRRGLADRPGSCPIFGAAGKFRDGSVHNGLGTLYATVNRSVVAEQVSLTTLDEFAQQVALSRLDLLKLDVEGSELAALRGGMVTLERFKPHLIIEVQQETARAAGHDAADILRQLMPLGYGFDIIGRHGRLQPVEVATLRQFQNVLCTPGGA
jgi:FkbM family methyltransferase